MALSLAFFAVLSLLIFGIVINPVLSQSQQTVFAQEQQQQPLQPRPSQQQQQQQQSNSLEVNKLLIKSFVQEVFNKHNLTALDKYYAPNVTQHNPRAGQGRQGFKQFFMPFFSSAFPDIHATIEHTIAENHVVLVFLNWTGTHKGEFQGMPATNKPINMRTADLFRIDTNGTIVEHWDVVDSLNLLKQTGMITFNQPNAKK
jgi:steroid delta-isomerase-like uncharacterized protein